MLFGRAARSHDHVYTPVGIVFDPTPVALAADTRTPHGHAQAMKYDRVLWTAAERKEMDNHNYNQSWRMVDRRDVPADANICNMLWVYKFKRDGTAKARLCVDGSGQIYGKDYDQTNASTLRTSTLRCFACIQATLCLHSRRKDLVSAYLQGAFEPGETVYCRCPPGHEVLGADDRPRILLIEKPIYGLKQAGRRLQRTMFPWLRAWRGGMLTQLYSDSCVFIARDGDDILIIGIFVDDAAILYRDDGPSSLYALFSADFHERWEAEDEGELSDLLNIHYRVTSDSVTLHQQPYIETLV